MDVQGPALVKTYADKFKVTFPVAVDPSDIFGLAFGLKAIPVSFLVDEVGITRLRGGGPSPDLLQKIEALLAEPLVSTRAKARPLSGGKDRRELEQAVARSATDWQSRLDLARVLEGGARSAEAVTLLEAAAKLQPANAEIRFTLGQSLLKQGRRDAALEQLKSARDLDPENWRIRKQIWALENPDKFYTSNSPDYGWQKEELAREKAQKSAAFGTKR